MTFNRPAFEAYVAAHSPLSPAQIDRMFGTVDAENKRAVWDFLKLDSRVQMAAFSDLLRAQQSIPGAVVLGVK